MRQLARLGADGVADLGWARWLLVAWMVSHIGLGLFRSLPESLTHALFPRRSSPVAILGLVPAGSTTLELRPTCGQCNAGLPHRSLEARTRSDECPFSARCESVLGADPEHPVGEAVARPGVTRANREDRRAPW